MSRSSFPWLLFLWLTALAGSIQVVKCQPHLPMGSLRRARFSPSSTAAKPPSSIQPYMYHLGSVAYVECPKDDNNVHPFLKSPLIITLQNFFLGVREKADQKRGFTRLLARGLRLWLVWHCTKNVFVTIFEDRWEAERDPERFFGKGHIWLSNAHKQTVKRRMKRGERNRMWVGIGYTPRYVVVVVLVIFG
jgi:hypothetical protein